MPDYTVMSYNVEWMSRLFDGAALKADAQSQARAQAIADVIAREDPDLLAICEAANNLQAHLMFIAACLPASNYQVAAGVSRGRQDLVIYYRPPVQVVSVDNSGTFYDPWTEDVDEDEAQERFRWERKPLEVVFEAGANGARLRLVLVHTKSKGIFDVVDLAGFQNLSLGNRKKLAAQAARVRERLDALLAAPNALPLIVLGDMNDGPGMDAYEKMLGRSLVEGVMGTVFELAPTTTAAKNAAFAPSSRSRIRPRRLPARRRASTEFGRSRAQTSSVARPSGAARRVSASPRASGSRRAAITRSFLAGRSERTG
jgi:hypothetical protein